ncbi:MAG: hypothetical protein NTZ64_00945 [Polaromonas sp.]|nr:hypothetical protein [Polaromonas sp.]
MATCVLASGFLLATSWLLLGYFLPLFSVDFLLTLVDFAFYRPAPDMPLLLVQALVQALVRGFDAYRLAYLLGAYRFFVATSWLILATWPARVQLANMLLCLRT